MELNQSSFSRSFLFLTGRENSLICCFILFSFLTGLVSVYLPEIGGSSEAREAHVIQLMTDQNDYVLPLRNGIVPSKPPLFHWIGVAASWLAGTYSPFSARIPSLIGGAIMLLVTAILAAQLRPAADSATRERLIIFALGALSTSYLFEKMRTVAMVDAIFSAMITVAIGVIAARLLRGGGVGALQSKDFTFFYLFSGLAVLAKGPAGVVIPGIFLCCALAEHFGLRTALLELLRPRVGWLVFILVALPWYFFAAMRQSNAFLGKQIFFENISRFIGGEHITEKPWWFYIPSLLREIAPWSLVFLAGLKSHSGRGDLLRNHGGERLVRSIYWFVGLVIILLSCARGKRESYLLPLLPWISLVVADIAVQALARANEKRVRGAGLLGHGLVYILLGLLMTVLLGTALCEWFGIRSGQPFFELIEGRLAHDFVPAGIVTAACVALICWGSRLDSRRNNAALLASFVALFSLTISLGFSVRNYFKDFGATALRIRGHVKDEPLLVARDMRDEFFDGVLYYLRREVALVRPADFPERCAGFALLRFDHWKEWRGKGQLANADVVEEFDEIDDHLRGRDINRKILIRCPIGTENTAA